jgi:hypothetical protein
MWEAPGGHATTRASLDVLLERANGSDELA